MEKFLALGDAEFKNEADARNWALGEWEAKPEQLTDKLILVVGAQYDSYEGAGFFLLRDTKTSQLYEVHGGHSSCYGFEGQFTPEATTIEYLLSDKFSFYDLGGDTQKEKFKDFLKDLK